MILQAMLARAIWRSALQSRLALAGLAAISLWIGAWPAAAQTPADPPIDCAGPDCPVAAEPAAVADKPPIKPKTVAEFTKDKVRQDGLFPVYRDPVSGAVFLEISAQQLTQQFIYYNFVRNGVSGLLAQLGDLRFAGQVGDNFAVRFRQRYSRIDVIRSNLQYVIDADSPLNRARGTNAGDSIMGTMTVVARDPGGERFIVAANPLFGGTDLFRMGNAAPILTMLGAMPSLNKAKSAIIDARSFPANTAVISEYVFDFKTGPAPITVELQHNLVAMPAAGFSPRRADPRVGLFTVQRTNLSRTDTSPIDDLIRRWRLEKRDTASALSPPVKPITFWIQNSTPLEYRDTIKRAAELWNPLFAKAGFDGVIVVQVQPDDADWDAGDVRYNLIQWIASPTPMFNGYGPSVVDPRTGEIIAANIVLEHGSLRTQHRLPLSMLPVAPTAVADAEHKHDGEVCSLAADLASVMGLALAQAAASDGGVGKAVDRSVINRLIHERLTYLVMHEVGHTLGLTHNMKGSIFRSVEELRRGIPPGEPITGSVMDYPAAVLLPDQPALGAVFPTVPGPYDGWAIRFAYDPKMADAVSRAELLSIAGTPGYVFGQDAEDMRMTGRGIDPRVMPYDMSSDPVGFGVEQLALIRQVQAALPSRLGVDTEALDTFVEIHNVLMTLYRQQVAAMSRQIGGVHDERDQVIGGRYAGAALQVVSPDQQRRAIVAIADAILAPGAVPFSPAYIANLVRARRGQAAISVADIDDEVGNIQQLVLDHVLHPQTLTRITSMAATTPGWNVDVMLDTMTAAVFDSDLGGAVTSRRRALQTRYTGELLAGLLEKLPAISSFRGSLLRQIKAIDIKLARSEKRGDAATMAARALMRHDFRQALNTDGRR